MNTFGWPTATSSSKVVGGTTNDDHTQQQGNTPDFSRIDPQAAAVNAVNSANLQQQQHHQHRQQQLQQHRQQATLNQQTGGGLQPQQIQQQLDQLQQARQAQQQQVSKSQQSSSHSNDHSSPESLDENGSPQDSTKLRKYNHRPISTTKRAQQNRSAQRAFRQRKEKYIQDLEIKARECEELKQQLEELRIENTQLRDYTLALQSKLISVNSTGNNNSIPAPPASFNKIYEK
ncbi:unnamed protein product [Candida verbasci]|uniref:Putative transcription factor kapC n=1 Tax=Candida verbasci TaxID=1227364 RepID=A0A9W4XFC1_9ASCO|nr:unnamed protein product [Candida verbasci]